MEETSDEVGLSFISFFRKLRKKRKILLDPVNPVQDIFFKIRIQFLTIF